MTLFYTNPNQLYKFIVNIKRVISTFKRIFFKERKVMATSIYVCNLPYDIDSDGLKETFERFGGVQSAKVVSDRETGRSRGFGFVEMEDQDAENAIQHLNGTEVSGRELKVSLAKPRQEKPSNGGRTGSFGSRDNYSSDRSTRSERY